MKYVLSCLVLELLTLQSCDKHIVLNKTHLPSFILRAFNHTVEINTRRYVKLLNIQHFAVIRRGGVNVWVLPPLPRRLAGMEE